MVARARFRMSVIGVLFALASVADAQARDYGQHGALFPIVEEDFLSVLKRRLMEMERNGRLAALNRQMSDRVKAQVLNPVPVARIQTAKVPRSWIFDPSITVEEDARDPGGQLIARKGTRINPLEHVSLRQRLVFVDGRDAAQVAWALRSAKPGSAKIILTAGSPIGLMRAHKRLFYFDQAGTLSQRFGIAHVPAVIEQEGKVLRIREIPMAPERSRDATVQRRAP